MKCKTCNDEAVLFDGEFGRMHVRCSDCGKMPRIPWPEPCESRGHHGPIEWNTEVVLCSYPPQYRGRCQSCGNSVTRHCFEVLGEPDPRTAPPLVTER